MIEQNSTSGTRPYGLEENALKVTGNHQGDTQFRKQAIKVPAEFFFHFYVPSLVDYHAFPLQSVVRCLWHPKLNQIMVGTGNGLAKVYYDPNKSQRYFISIACFRWMTATGGGFSFSTPTFIYFAL